MLLPFSTMMTARKAVVEKLIKQLDESGLNVVTDLRPTVKFWKAEDYHQDYYARNGKTPYCHAYTSRFPTDEPS